MELEERCNMACFILQQTNDGDHLSPRDLKIVEMAVNGQLNDRGIVEFAQLFHAVRKGEYKKPYFHNIEHLTIDHEGYIYWKGRQVEHYNQPWAYSEEAKRQAHGLAGICKAIENEGAEVTAARVMSNF